MKSYLVVCVEAENYTERNHARKRAEMAKEVIETGQKPVFLKKAQ